MNYLNKALDIFNTSIVTPIYYVFFTSCVIVASAILFNEWMNLNPADILGVFIGFVTIVLAIFLLNGFQNWDVRFSNLNIPIMRENSIDSGSEVIEPTYHSTESETEAMLPSYHVSGDLYTNHYGSRKLSV